MSNIPETDKQLHAVYINCSIKHDSQDSHTQLLMNRSIYIMEQEGVAVTTIYALDHEIAFGMTKDAGKDDNHPRTDGWPQIQKQIEAKILW